MTVTPRPPSLWDQATSTRGGRWAVAVAIVAICLLVATAAAALASSARQDRATLTNAAADVDGQAKAKDKDKDKANGNNGQGQGNGQANGQGNGDLNSIPGRLGGTLHGEVTRPGAAGGTETLLVQTGVVTASSDTSVTVKSTDGFSETYAVAATTTVRGPAKAAGLTAGTRVTVVATKDGKQALLVASKGGPS